jgi:hypothetical protein
MWLNVRRNVLADFDSLQEQEKNFIAVAIIFVYTMVFLTLTNVTIQLKIAKRGNQQTLFEMKKDLQVTR